MRDNRGGKDRRKEVIGEKKKDINVKNERELADRKILDLTLKPPPLVPSVISVHDQANSY